MAWERGYSWEWPGNEATWEWPGTRLPGSGLGTRLPGSGLGTRLDVLYKHWYLPVPRAHKNGRLE